MLLEIPNTLVQPLQHWQEIWRQDQSRRRRIEQALRAFEECKECEAVRELGCMGEQMCL